MKKNKQLFISYECRCGCKITKKGFENFNPEKNYLCICPFCGKKIFPNILKNWTPRNTNKILDEGDDE